MSKFNKPLAVREPDTTTPEGGEGFSRTDAREELFLLGLANMVGEDTFYESGKSRDFRFAGLVASVTASDPEWVRGFVGWLRQVGNMRSAPLVAAAEYVAAGGPNGRQVVSSVLQRPDEPGEMIGYWFATHGRNLPQPVKRGIADALGRLYTERNLLRYDGQGKPIRWGDVIDLVHPAPKDAAQSALFRFAIDRRHNREPNAELLASLPTVSEDVALMAIPESERRANVGRAQEAGWSWERLAGWLPGGMDAAGWEAAIPNMGAMALVRNLRNFDDAGISDRAVAHVRAVLTDPDAIRRSRQFPLRFLSAWKNVASMRWGDALETALNHSLANVPSLDGRTLVLIDVSGSMMDEALSARKGTGVTPQRWEVATVFGVALARAAKDARVVLFSTQPVAEMNVAKADSVLRLAEECARFVGGGTNIAGSLAATYSGEDRVVILTDEQAGYGQWHEISGIRVPVFTFNLAGYQQGVTPNDRNWLTIGGLTDAAFTYLDAFEAHRVRGWPWS